MANIYVSKLDILKLLKVWAGSIWRLIIWDMVMFFLLRTFVGIVYRYFIIYHAEVRGPFELFLDFNQKINDASPLSFLTAFFVSTVLMRFIGISGKLPWLAVFAHYLGVVFETENEENMLLFHEVKRTYLRYLLLSSVLFFSSFSESIKSRFKVYPRNIPKIDLIKRKFVIINSDPVIRKTYGKLITQEEINIYADIICQESNDSEDLNISSWIPLKWCSDLLSKLVSENVINDCDTEISILRYIKGYQEARTALYRWITYNIPLPYLQAILFVVYAFRINMIFSIPIITTPIDQLKSDLEINEALDLLFPLVIYFKFFMYVAWFKIGISMANPFNEKLSKFPTNFILNQMITASANNGLTNESILPVYSVNHIDDEKELKYQKEGYMKYFGQSLKSVKVNMSHQADFFCENQIPDAFIYRKFYP